MKKSKKLSKWSYADFNEYMSRRACDGNWSLDVASACSQFMFKKPHFIFFKKRKNEAWWQSHRHEILNIKTDPIYDIVTGNLVDEE